MSSARFKGGGFFSLERRVFAEDMAGDLELVGIWAWLIAAANHSDGKRRLDGGQGVLKRGQVATSAQEIARYWGLAVRTVGRRLAYLEETGRISQVVSGAGRIVTITKYDEYQRRREKSDEKRRLEEDAFSENQETINSVSAARDRPVTDGLARAWHELGTSVASNCPSEVGAECGNEETKKYDSAARDRRLTDDWPTIDRPVTDERHHKDKSNKKTMQQGNLGLFTGDVSDAPPAQKMSGRKTTRSEAAAERKVAKSTATLEAYGTAMLAMHRFEPVPNAPLRSMACKLVDLLGADAPAVAEYYVLNEKAAWVVQNRHPFGELVKNAQKYFGNWKTGTKVAAATARALERHDASRDMVDRLVAYEERRKQEGHA